MSATATPTNGRRIETVSTEADRLYGLGDFLNLVLDAESGNRQRSEPAKDRLANQYRIENRAINVASGTNGGYLMPQGLQADVMAEVANVAIVRPRATVVTLNSDEDTLPILAPSAPTGGAMGFLGGFSPRWDAEGTTTTETDPTFAGVKLVARELRGGFSVPMTMLRWSPNLLSVAVRKTMAGAIADMEDAAFLTGAIAGRPLGITTSPALVTTAARAGAAGITFADIRSVWARVLPSSKGRAIGIVSAGAESALLDAAASANSAVVASNLNPLNREHVTTLNLPALNSLGDYLAADLTYFVVGDDPRLSMEITASEHVSFRGGQVAIRLVHRVAGMPWVNAPLTVGSTTYSPFVALGTA